ncbi:MAG: hypothetical protein SWK90_07135 [Chloroflexota bacterium]|nr:hypothetical protein [Chloroflexota bacterium]
MKITSLSLLQGWGLSAYARLIWRTARYCVEGQEHVDQVHASGHPLIIAAWHGMTMMFTGYIAAQEDPSQYVLVVPDDHRGAVLSVWARRLGAISFPISMKADSMVAARRLLALIRQMKEGKSLYLNPDGPDGPSHEPKGGVVFIARKAGALVVPAGAFTATGIHLSRWDRYTIPFPFSRITVVLGEPLEVRPESDPDQMQAMVRERLNEVERAAEALYRRASHA